MRVRGLSKHLLVELCKCFPSPLSFLPLPTPFAFRGIVRVDASLSCAAYSCERVLSFNEMFCRPTTPFCDNKNRGAPFLSPSSLFGKFYSCWYARARRSRDIWRFDIDVSVSGFRPPPPPPFFSSFFVHPFLLSFSSPQSPPSLTSDEWQGRECS